MTDLLSTTRPSIPVTSRPAAGRPSLMTLVMLLSISLPMLFHATGAASDPRRANGYVQVTAAPAEIPPDARGHLELRALDTGVATAVHPDTLRTGTRLALSPGPYTVVWVDGSEQDVIETEGFSAGSAVPASGGRSEALSAEACNDASRGDAPVLSVLPERVTTLRIRPGAVPAPVSLML